MKRFHAALCALGCAAVVWAFISLVPRTPPHIPEDGPTRAQIDAIHTKYGLEPPVERPQTDSVDWGWSARP